MNSLSKIFGKSRTGKFLIYFFNKLLNELLFFVIPNPLINQVLYLNEDDISINFCKVKKLYKSEILLTLRKFLNFRKVLVGIHKFVIPKRSEESHKLMIPKNLNFKDIDVLHLADVGHLVQKVLQSKSSDVIGKRSEESHKLMIPKNLYFKAIDVLHLADVGHQVQESLQIRSSDVIGKRSEESHKLMIPKNLNFKDIDVLHLADVGHLVQESLQIRSSDVIGKRSEESHKSLLPQSLRFFTSFRMTRLSFRMTKLSFRMTRLSFRMTKLLFRMTDKRILYYSFLLLLLITSCAHVPIKLKQLNSEINVEEGQEATVVWKFENALQVKIDGDGKLYYPFDSIKIKPKTSTTIKIIAYQSEKDSLAVYSNINIKKDYAEQRTSGIQRGPSLLEQYKDTLSKTEAYFKKGETNYNFGNPPEHLKTVGSIYPYYSPNTCLIKTLILDKFGNFITNLENQNNLKIAVTSTCSEFEFLNNVEKIEYVNDTNNDFFTDNLIVLDVSSKSHNHFQVFEEIKQFAKRLSINDNLGFSLFNHSYRQIVPINSAEASNFAIQNTLLQEKSGLNAMLSSISSAIYQLKETTKNKKNLIIISSSTDDCSFNTNINEIVQLAKENHISIYSIGLGNEVDGYGLSFLSSATGGKYYVLEDNELSLIKNALSEILFSQRTYYQFEVPVSFYLDKCSEVKTNIELTFDSLKISDKSSIFLKEDLKYYPRFIAALFNENNFSIDEEYRQNVVNIADYLLLNSHIKIEIIGHSSENESSYKEVGNLRAVKLMEQLISLGVNSIQIRIKSEEATKPIYLEPADNFQEKYNRRVEIKILDPSQLPYQIAAEKTNAESDAALLVNIWKKLGYKSYFERVIIEKNPEYHVKIWGYPTIEQAQEEAIKINKLYNKDFVAE